MAAYELTDRDKAVLEFERKRHRHTGAKEEAIRRTFKLSAARYYQLLNNIIDRPEALAYDPMLVKRLLNGRERRERLRAAIQFG
jgi:hypothetical protein